MARFKVEQSIFRNTSSVMRPGEGAEVLITLRNGQTATVYAGRTGSSPADNPLVVGANGRVPEVYLDLGSYLGEISGEGLDDYTIDIEAVTGDTAPGAELGYVESEIAFTTTSTSNVDVTNMELTVTTDGQPIKVEFAAVALLHTASNGIPILSILEDDTIVFQYSMRTAAANCGQGVSPFVRRQPSAGEHTYKVQVLTSIFGAAGTVTVNAGAEAPMQFLITNV
jgi:hypothetical protein